MIHKLDRLAKVPSHHSEFMTDFDVRYRTDITLARGIKAVLPQLTEYFDSDDSRNVLKEPTHDTRNVDKEMGDDNRNINKEEVDDSRNVLKDRAARTIEWGGQYRGLSQLRLDPPRSTLGLVPPQGRPSPHYRP